MANSSIRSCQIKGTLSGSESRINASQSGMSSVFCMNRSHVAVSYTHLDVYKRQAQRISSVEDADKVIVLNHGAVDDFGTPQELSLIHI